MKFYLFISTHQRGTNQFEAINTISRTFQIFIANKIFLNISNISKFKKKFHPRNNTFRTQIRIQVQFSFLKRFEQCHIVVWFNVPFSFGISCQNTSAEFLHDMRSQNTHIHTSLTFTVYPILAFSSSHVIVHFVVVVVFIQVYWNAKFCSYFFLF